MLHKSKRLWYRWLKKLGRLTICFSLATKLFIVPRFTSLYSLLKGGGEQGVIAHNLVRWCFSFPTTYSGFVWLFLAPFTHTHTRTHTRHTHCECVIYLILANDYRVKMYAAIEFVFHYGYIILHFARWFWSMLILCDFLVGSCV